MAPSARKESVGLESHLARQGQHEGAKRRGQDSATHGVARFVGQVHWACFKESHQVALRLQQSRNEAI